MRLYKFILSAFLTSSVFLLGADVSPIGLLNLQDVLDKAKACTIETYPNSDEVLVDDYIKVTYKADGTGETWDDTIFKILTDKGREDYKILSFNYTLPYSQVEIKKLDVIKPDGRMIPVDVKANAREMVDDSQMFANIYNPNDKILRVTIPELEIGDCVRYVTCETIYKAIIPDAWFDMELLESTSPVVHFKYEIIAPKDRPVMKRGIPDKIPNCIADYVIQDGDNIKYVWEAKNVPRMFPEPNMPPISSVVQRVLASTINSWEDVSKWYWNLCLPHLNATTPEMEKTVKDLIKDETNDMGKIKAIYYFVAQQVRYMGVTTETDAPGFEPHDVSITFNNRYGVCRDKAALLVAMLKLAGYKAYPVIIMVGPKLDKDVPLPFFNHAVCCVQLSDGKMVFMDPTNESSKDIFPAYLCDRSYLVAKPDGATLMTTPIIPARENMVEIATDGTLSPDGLIDVESVIKFDGINDSLYRGHFAKLSNDERRTFFENILRKAIPNSQLFYYTITPENLFDMSSVLSVKMRFTAKKSFVSGDNMSALNLPWIGGSIGIVNYIIGTTGLTERKYPLVTEVACGYSEKINLALPDTFKTEGPPKFKEINSDTLDFNRKITIKDKKLTASSEFLINGVEFSPKQYLELKKDLQIMEINDRIKLLGSSGTKNISSNSPLPQERSNDARVLFQGMDVTLNEDGSTIEKFKTQTKILTYNGKKDNSEIKVTYNPAWETVNVVKAQVTSATGKVQKLGPTELNIMDSSWVASAPRYPAEKLLVASLPGVEVGSTIEVEYEATTKDKPFYSDMFVFRSRYPVDKYSVDLKVSNDRNILIDKKNADALSEKITKEDDYTTYSWTAYNQSAVVQEVSFPPVWDYLPVVIVSDGNWKDYTESIGEHFEDIMDDNPNCKELANKLIDGKTTDQDKILAIRNFIEININRAGPSFTDLPLSALSKPDITLQDGYGNDADTALLYSAMLKSVGIKSEFLIASSLPYLEELTRPILKTPQRQLFNFILIGVKDSQGNEVYLNDTDQYASYGSVTHERECAILLNDASSIQILAAKGQETSVELIVNTVLSKDLSAEISITKKLYGNEYGANNRLYALLTPEDKARFYKELISQISQSAVSIDELKCDFSTYPGIETFKVKVPDYCVKEGSYIYFNSYLGNATIFALGAREKFYPYYNGTTLNFKLANTIIFPDDTEKVMIKPSSCNFTIPGGTGTIYISSMSATKESLTYYDVIEYKLHPSIIPPEDYSRLVDIQDYLSSGQNSMYLFKIK
ncbi:MAG: DUF3857 domain-containing protein [Lentisphaerota bacterium]